MDDAVKLALYSHFPNIEENSQQRFWLDRYVRFIENCQKKDWIQSTNEYLEVHHIIPKSWGGTNDKNNLITFPYRAHVIAHQLLAKTQDKSMCIAMNSILAHFPNKQLNFVTARLVAEIREQMAIAKSRIIINLHTGETISTAELARKYDCSTASIIGCIVNNTKFKNEYWKFIEDVDDPKIALEQLNQQKIAIKEKHKEAISVANGRPVVNLNTGEAFDNATQAIIAYGRSVRNRGAIYKAINGGYKFADCFWQFKDVVDQSSIEKELQTQLSKQIANRETSIQKRYKPVINTTTGEEFAAIKLAAQACGAWASSIRNAIIKKTKCCGCYWEWKDADLQRKIDNQHEIEVQNQKQRRIEANKKSSVPVVCIETGQVFESRTQAAQCMGVKNASQITKAIETGHKVKGYHWCELQDYQQSDQQSLLQSIEDERQNRQRNKSKKLRRPVINLNTGEIYSSATEVMKVLFGENVRSTFNSYIQTNSKLKGCYYQYLDVVETSSIEEELRKCEQRAAVESEQRRQKTLKPVINLTTGERFDSAKSASRAYNAKFDGYVPTAIRTKRPFADCFWIYEKDLKGNREDILAQYIAEYNKTHPEKQIKI